MDLGQFGKEFLYSALIALIFAGSGRLWSRLNHRRASGAVSMQMGQVMGGLPASQPLAPPFAPPVARRGVNFGRVLLHIGVFQFVVNVLAFLIGFLIGFALVSSGQSVDSASSQLLLLLVILVVGTSALIAGFLIIGLRVERSTRLLHMTYVALGVAATTLIINWLTGALHPTSAAGFIGSVVFALIQTYFGMGVGGGLSFLIGGQQGAAPLPAPMSQPYRYGVPPGAPLYPGQPVGPSRPLYPPQPGPQPYGPQYPPQPYSPQPHPPQQGAPQYPPVQPPTRQYPRYPQQPAAQPPTPQYPQYPQRPPQQPPAGEQGGRG